MSNSERGKKSPRRLSAPTPEKGPPVEIEFVFGAPAGAEDLTSAANPAGPEAEPARKYARNRVRFRFGSSS